MSTDNFPGTVSGGMTLLNEVVLFSSTTWTPASDVDAVVTLVAGAGSGAAVNVDGIGDRGAATGGNAGGLVRKRMTFKGGVTYTATIGAGGAGVDALGASSPTGANGNDGGDTTLSGSGMDTLTALGGKGGVYDLVTDGSGPATAAPQAAVSGTNGDLNAEGGQSGTAATENYNQTIACTGGGSVGLWTNGYSSGDATATSNIDAMAVTGGAGTGGNSADMATSVSTAYQAGGGGCSGPAASFGVAGPNAYGVVPSGTPGVDAYDPISILWPVGSGSDQQSTSSTSEYPGATGGGGAGVVNGSATHIYASDGGNFAGGGAAICYNASYDAHGGDGKLGGGGGAAGSREGSNAYSGDGGDGIIVIQIVGIG